MAKSARTLALVAAAAAGADAAGCGVFRPSPDVVEIRSPFVRASLNLTSGSLDVLQGAWLGGAAFDASPNLAGQQGAPAGGRRGAVSVLVWPAGGGAPTATSGFDRAAPAPVTVLANSSSLAAFSVTLADAPSASVTAVLTFTVADAAPRRLALAAVVTTARAVAPALVSLDVAATPPDAVGWYGKGVRQGMLMTPGFIVSADGWNRSYLIGDGVTGALEFLPGDAATAAAPSYLFAGDNAGFGTAGGFGVALFGAPAPVDTWAAGVGAGAAVPLPAGASASASLTLLPNDAPFPPSDVPATLPSRVNTTDLRTILQGVHGAAVSPLHSYDFAPEVRAAPCLIIRGQQCYSPLYNFYDPDSAISNSALLYTFDAPLAAQVRGQLETNLRYICPAGSPASLCRAGQAIHHFTADCQGQGPECFCVTGPGGVSDCAVYDAISGAVQSGPNVFQIFAALRYAGVTGDAAWLAATMPTLRAAMGFLDAVFDGAVGLYSLAGSLQIDVFIRQNFTADTNAMAVLLGEAFADAEQALGNATGAAFYRARAATVRAAMGRFLLAADGSHYCTQSDPAGAPGAVKVCARDFVDYDANAIAVAARVPGSVDAANKILARMDSGKCTHAGRATYVSEVYYDKANCVGGNTGDSAVSMGRIAWQDALARKAVGDAAAAAAFSALILNPLQRDMLARTWLPERFDCEGGDAHNQYYFEYSSVVAMLLFEVKYGISLSLIEVRVEPLTASNFDLVLGASAAGLWIGHYGDGFYAALPALHVGARAFHVARMAPGAYSVAVTGAAPAPAAVGADGVLRFSAVLGPGISVNATRTAAA